MLFHRMKSQSLGKISHPVSLASHTNHSIARPFRSLVPSHELPPLAPFLIVNSSRSLLNVGNENNSDIQISLLLPNSLCSSSRTALSNVGTCANFLSFICRLSKVEGKKELNEVLIWIGCGERRNFFIELNFWWILPGSSSWWCSMAVI